MRERTELGRQGVARAGTGIDWRRPSCPVPLMNNEDRPKEGQKEKGTPQQLLVRGGMPEELYIQNKKFSQASVVLWDKERICLGVPLGESYWSHSRTCCIGREGGK